MTYSKPEVSILGGAAHVIEALTKTIAVNEQPRKANSPAYDLDE